MATLNLNEKKMMSDDNLRLFANLLLSLSSKVQSAENKLINNWIASTAYIKDESFVIYDELLYVCKISNADNTFDKNKWTCLSPTIEELSKSDVEAMLNLSQEELDNLQNLLKDDQITTTSTHSSSKIYSDIQAAIETAKEYTNEQTGKCVKPAYKVVTSTGDVTETGYFYLISNGTNYDMYVLGADGSVVSLGTSDVDLSDYAKLTDLDSYYDKVDADGKFATITTVDGKVDKTSILSATSDSATDEQVYSASIMNTELDKKANDDEVVKKTSMSTIINNTSTDDSIPTSKTLYNLLGIKNFTEEEINSYGNQTMETGMVSNTIAKTVITDTINDWYYLIKLPWDGKYNSQIWISASGEQRAFIRYTKSVGVWDTPKLICTTKVADVPSTSITNKLVSSKVSLTNPDSYVAYCVKNGTCQVTIWSMQINAACSEEKLFEGLPKSLIGATTNLCNELESFGQVFIAPGSTTISLNANASVVGKNGYCSFSYQVAE